MIQQHSRETCTDGLECPRCWPKTGPISTKPSERVRLMRLVTDLEPFTTALERVSRDTLGDSQGLSRASRDASIALYEFIGAARRALGGNR